MNKTGMKRILKTGGYSRENATKMINSQLPDGFLIDRQWANYTLSNMLKLNMHKTIRRILKEIVSGNERTMLYVRKCASYKGDVKITAFPEEIDCFFAQKLCNIVEVDSDEFPLMFNKLIKNRIVEQISKEEADKIIEKHEIDLQHAISHRKENMTIVFCPHCGKKIETSKLGGPVSPVSGE